MTRLPSTYPSTHIAGCPACSMRWDRAFQLEELRRTSPDRSRTGLPSRPQLPSRGVVYTAMLSPLGTLWIAAGPRGLVRVESFTDEAAFCHALALAGYGVARYQPETLDGIVAQFAEYFAGRRSTFDLPIDLSRVTGFRRAVLEAVLAVPYGRVQSYQDIAYSVCKPRATRAVGAAVATNPISLVVPCHRIVRNDGSAGEYAVRAIGSCGVHYKLMLLALEGHPEGTRLDKAARERMRPPFSTMRPTHWRGYPGGTGACRSASSRSRE